MIEAKGSLPARGRLFLIGVGGIGMSGLAQLLVRLGYEVGGSDRGLAEPDRADLFDRDMPIRFLPIKWDKLRMKLEAARRCGYDKAITFEFSHFMSPQSAYLQAGHLYDRYKEYFDL